MVNMFIGQSYPSFESKKRLVLPAKYRNELGEEFYGLVDFDHCISLYPSSLYQKRAESIDSLDNFSSDNRLLKRLFFGNSCELKIDKVGRVLIPQTILYKAHIKLDKEVILVGVYDHLELWDLETYNEKNNSSDDEKCYEALAERLAAK